MDSKNDLSLMAAKLIEKCAGEYDAVMHGVFENLSLSSMESWKMIDQINDLISDGLDCSYVATKPSGAREHPMWYTVYIDAPGVGPSLMKTFLENGADPNMGFEGETFFESVNSSVGFDRYTKEYAHYVQCWLLLMAYGGKYSVDGSIPLTMLNGNDVSIFKEYEKYDYWIENLPDVPGKYGNWIMHIYDIASNVEVARYE